MKRLLLLLAVALSSACGDRSAVVPELLPFAAPGFARFARTGDLVLGGQPSPGALRYLADHGFTTVVSTRAATELDWDERAAVESLGMRFVSIPIPLPVSAIRRAQVAALDSVFARHDGPILLHCAGGTRAVALWAQWLAETRKLEAAATMQRAELAGMKIVQPIAQQLLGTAGP